LKYLKIFAKWKALFAATSWYILCLLFQVLVRFLTEDKIDHRTALTIAFRLQCLLTEYSKFTLLKDGSDTYQVCMCALCPYRVQQVYIAQGQQWHIPGMYACIVSLLSTASLHCSKTAVKHTWYVCVHCLLTDYSKFTLLKDGSETYQVGRGALFLFLCYFVCKSFCSQF